MLLFFIVCVVLEEVVKMFIMICLIMWCFIKLFKFGVVFKLWILFVNINVKFLGVWYVLCCVNIVCRILVGKLVIVNVGKLIILLFLMICCKLCYVICFK